MDPFEAIRADIIADEMNSALGRIGYVPVYTTHPEAKIAIISQAPGIKAQESQTPWNDVSGRLLRQWLDVSDADFYDPTKFAIIPMDFYYPGKGAHGDLPPRKGFADKWHKPIFDLMPKIELSILVGSYAQKYYLGKNIGNNLTATVRDYQRYLPKFFPLVHPSPLNYGWRKRNPWFETEVVTDLKSHVRRILADSTEA